DDSIGAGDPLQIFGSGPPNSRVEVAIAGQSGSAELAEEQVLAATSSSNGDWSVTVDTKRFSKGTYIIQAVVTRADQTKSGLSKYLVLTVGGASSGNINRSDIN